MVQNSLVLGYKIILFFTSLEVIELSEQYEGMDA